jgi:hypothetical protein
MFDGRGILSSSPSSFNFENPPFVIRTFCADEREPAQFFRRN